MLVNINDDFIRAAVATYYGLPLDEVTDRFLEALSTGIIESISHIMSNKDYYQKYSGHPEIVIPDFESSANVVNHKDKNLLVIPITEQTTNEELINIIYPDGMNAYFSPYEGWFKSPYLTKEGNKKS